MHKDNIIEINKKYLDKTMRTLSILMNQMNMMYYWEKIRLEYCDQDILSIFDLEKLMSRCVKLYKMIDQFINIFKLISKKEVSLQLESYLYLFLCSVWRQKERKMKGLIIDSKQQSIYYSLSIQIFQIPSTSKEDQIGHLQSKIKDKITKS